MRTINIVFTFSDGEFQNMLDLYTVEISTDIGLIALAPKFPSEADSANIAAGIVNDGDPKNNYRISKMPNEQRYIIVLFGSFPSISPAEDDRLPFIRFKTNDGFVPVIGNISEIQLTVASSGTSFNLNALSLSPALSRNLGTQIEAGSQLFITTETNTQVLLRIPELFVKLPERLRVTLPSGYTRETTEFLYNNAWLAIDANDQLTGNPAFHETKHLTAQEAFDFAQMGRNADGWIRIAFRAPGTLPRTLSSNEITVSYTTMPAGIPGSSAEMGRQHFISYFTSLGDWVVDNNRTFRPNPRIEQPKLQLSFNEKSFKKEKEEKPIANGNLLLGFENIVPGQTLSVLFEMAEGTGNPDHYAPDIAWSYLAHDRWIGFPPQFILKDTSLGMKQTGIIVFQVPADIVNGNSWVVGKDDRKDLYWLRASASENKEDSVLVDALPMLIDIHVNAGIAVFADNNNSEAHLENGLPASRIAALRFKDVNVKTVSQPYASFNGRRSEQSDTNGYIRRIHERLRHKDRAVTLWDYERITLEAFPKVAVVKCLPHSRRVYTARPGHVSLAVIPSPERMRGNRKYYPTFNAGDLSSIRDHLAKRNSFFVGGYGDPGFCCCDDGCKCDHQPGRIDVINAVFEPVRLKICVRFVQGKDIPYYTKELNEALKDFLSPWAKQNKQPLLFGVPISLTRLLQFLEKLDYVDVIMHLRVKHFSSRQMSEQFETYLDWSEPGEIIPFTAASVLTTYTDRLNEDNPNVIDHEINVIEEHDKCACSDCVEEDDEGDPDGNPDGNGGQPAEDPRVEELRQVLRELWMLHPRSINKAIADFALDLNERVGSLLTGNIPQDPEEETAGNAYSIFRVKGSNSKVIQLEVNVAFEPNKFTKFFVNNPKLNS
jgi:hypothetical protein